jgi:hypothetical protein
VYVELNDKQPTKKQINKSFKQENFNAWANRSVYPVCLLYDILFSELLHGPSVCMTLLLGGGGGGGSRTPVPLGYTVCICQTQPRHPNARGQRPAPVRHTGVRASPQMSSIFLFLFPRFVSNEHGFRFRRFHAQFLCNCLLSFFGSSASRPILVCACCHLHGLDSKSTDGLDGLC